MASLLAVAVQGKKEACAVLAACALEGTLLCPKECLIRVIHGASACTGAAQRACMGACGKLMIRMKNSS